MSCQQKKPLSLRNNYQRILIKISGEALRDEKNTNIISNKKLSAICDQIVRIANENIEIGIVVGGGNIWRGEKDSKEIGMDRAQADYMGMIATIMNALAIQNKIEQLNKQAIVYSAIECPKVAEDYIRRNIMKNLSRGRITIFAGGTGYPYFTTDTAAALRAVEIEADVLLMAKNKVDGVYTSDPLHDKKAERFEKLTYKKIMELNLEVMDQTAVTLCQENKIDIIVFNVDENNNIWKAMTGIAKSTIITN